MIPAERAGHRSGLPASVDAVLHARERPITVDEYHAMGKAGILTDDDRVELLDGRLIAMSPVGPSHLHCVNRLNEMFGRRLYRSDDPSARLSIQNPVRLSDASEPEPDVVLLRPDAAQDRVPAPDAVLLLIEVAESSVDYDRDVKARRYAAARIPEYWLVDLAAETVEVFRRPDGETYAERIRHRRGDTLDVSTLPEMDAVPVAAILG